MYHPTPLNPHSPDEQLLEQPHQAIVDLLASNPMATLAYIDAATSPPTLHVYCHTSNPPFRLSLPTPLRHFRIEHHAAYTFHDMRAPTTTPQADTPEQRCQNEPISLGTQIQPYDANWLGTAGAPCRWIDGTDKPHWGILSNWHVMADGNERIGRAIHQPTALQPAMARLADWVTVLPDKTNEIDAAVADTWISPAHTTAWQILGLDQLNAEPKAAAPGLTVQKTGRTTGTTSAKCQAINAGAKIGYGGFTATFIGLDVFQDITGHFCGPGDSGSLIIATDGAHPCALLFAGGDDLTLGIPIAKIMEKFHLTFSP